MMSSKSKIKVAVIGAGAAGLCAGRHLIAEPDKFDVDIFEQQDDVGGTWRYSAYINKDQYGLPVHSSMYKNLRTNLAKESMAFPDFPFKTEEETSFLPHTRILQYLDDYAKHYGVKNKIKFCKLVENIRPLKKLDSDVEWAVSFSDVISKEKDSYIYDAVMVCNGHYSVPFIPDIKGLDTFKGLILHSHDYREPVAFKGMKVVVLGAGASGIDISIEVSQFAKEVTLSHNNPPVTTPLPPNMRQQTGIRAINNSSIIFINGQKQQYDALILCTGYLYHYPFLDKSCNLELGDQRVSPLYMHLFHAEFPTLAIWAIPKLILPFPMYDQQVKVFLKFLKGQIQLPTTDEMRLDMENDYQKRLESGLKPRQAHLMPHEWQWEYDDKLSKLGDIRPIRQVVRDLFRHVRSRRVQDVLTYRDYNFKIVDDCTFEEV